MVRISITLCLVPAGPGACPGKAVINKGWGKQFIDDRHVPLVQRLLKDMADNRFVFFDGHGIILCYGRASSTILNGVSVARRKRVKPPLVTTSRSFASPACAPNARPTS